MLFVIIVRVGDYWSHAHAPSPVNIVVGSESTPRSAAFTIRDTTVVLFTLVSKWELTTQAIVRVARSSKC
jgi:hypothetical protein